MYVLGDIIRKTAKFLLLYINEARSEHSRL